MKDVYDNVSPSLCIHINKYSLIAETKYHQLLQRHSFTDSLLNRLHHIWDNVILTKPHVSLFVHWYVNGTEVANIPIQVHQGRLRRNISGNQEGL